MSKRNAPTSRLLERLWPMAAREAPEVAQTLFYEVVPSAQFSLPHLDGATFADRDELARGVLAELVPAILRAAGASPEDVKTQIGPGGYELKTSPSLQSHVHLADPEADRVAAALGWVFRQESVLVADLNDAIEGHTYYVIADFPEGVMTPMLADAFFQHAASIDPGLGEGYTAFQDDLLFLNVRGADGKPYSHLDDEAFGAAMRKAAAAFTAVAVSSDTRGIADARFVDNDWTSDPDGEAYGRRLGSELVAALGPLRERHTVLVLEAAKRHEWG